MRTSIEPPERLRESLGISAARRVNLDQPFLSIDEYLDHYGTLQQLTDQVFQSAIEGGYIDQSRAAALGDWLDRHPLIAGIYPYPQLRRALAIATAPDCWTSDREIALLRFITVFCLQKAFGLNCEELLDLPRDLFGDMYEALFDVPAATIDFSNQYLEVTGPCEKGSHNAMVERAIAAGGLCRKGSQRSGYLFVANDHIQKRVMSNKIAFAIFARLKHGPSIQILPEDYYPLQVAGSIRTAAGGYIDGPQRDTLRALLYFLDATDQMNSKAVEIIAAAYKTLYGFSIITDSAALRLVEHLEKPSRPAFNRIVGSIHKSGDQIAKAELLRLTDQIISHASAITDTTQEALDYMTRRFAKSE